MNYTRPPSSTPHVPITLLHTVFNEFLEDCENYRPSKDDHLLALTLSHAMSDLYIDEKERQTAFIKVLGGHGIFLEPGEIVGTSFTTDGDLRTAGFPRHIAELKWEIGSKGAEPIFQGALYYTSHMRNHIPLASVRSAFPCLGLYLAGKYFISSVLNYFDVGV